MQVYGATRTTHLRTDNLGRTVDSRDITRLQITLGMAANKELPREPTAPPRGGFVGTFLLAGCLVSMNNTVGKQKRFESKIVVALSKVDNLRASDYKRWVVV